MEQPKTRAMNHGMFILVLLLGALWTGACSGLISGPPERKTAAKAQTAPDPLSSIIKAEETQDLFLRSQVDVGLEARLSRPGVVQVTLKNKTTRPLGVGPKFFCLIVPPGKDKIPAAPESRKAFPVLELPAGEQVSGELLFPPQALTPKARLVFNNPQCRAALARIQ